MIVLFWQKQIRRRKTKRREEGGDTENERERNGDGEGSGEQRGEVEVRKGELSRRASSSVLVTVAAQAGGCLSDRERSGEQPSWLASAMTSLTPLTFTLCCWQCDMQA